MSDIFISYHSQDRARVKPIVEVLVAKGWSVFWDRQIGLQEMWPDVIEENLDAAKCALVIWSHESVERKWVRREARDASNRDILIAVFIDNAKIPLEFNDVQAVNLTGWSGVLPDPDFDDEFDKLIKKISDLVTPQVPEAALPASQPKSPEAVNVFPSDDQAKADEAWRNMFDRQELESSVDRHETGTKFWRRKKEFWFDYVANRGDDLTSTYNLAYLCLSRLWMRERWQVKSSETETSLYLDQDVGSNEAGLVPLPRGEFLAVGWYTIPFVSFLVDIHSRLEGPFKRAYQDLEADLKAVGMSLDSEDAQKSGRNCRPLIGIPANRGDKTRDSFRRQFFAPLQSQSANAGEAEHIITLEQLSVSGFKRHQKSNHSALRLPFGWMFWGLELYWGAIDEEQAQFFLSTNGGKRPDKLIVAAGSPTTVGGQYGSEDRETARAYYRLKLPRYFLREAELNSDEKLRVSRSGEIRLDLASEAHQYVRYWGSASWHSPRLEKDKAVAPSAPDYASVVSGLGDAFHDPTTIDVGEIKEQAIYPAATKSRHAVAAELFKPLKVAQTSGIWLIGAVIAAILAFAAIVNDSTRPAIHNFRPFNMLGLTAPERYYAIGSTSGEFAAAADRPEAIRGMRIWELLGVSDGHWRPIQTSSDCSPLEPKFFWGKCRVAWPRDYAIGFMLTLVTVPLLTVGLILSGPKYLSGTYDPGTFARVPEQTLKDAVLTAKHATRKVIPKLWCLLIFTFFVAALGFLSVTPYREFITPFGNSLLVTLSFTWVLTCVFIGVRYVQWLTRQSTTRRIDKREWWFVWALAAAAFASLAAALLMFGKASFPLNLVADMLFVMTVISTPMFLILFAASGLSQRGSLRAGVVLLGLWHGLLHVGVAWFLIMKGTWLTVALSLVVLLAFMRVGERLMRANRPRSLLVAWVLLAAFMFALPPLVYSVLRKFGSSLPLWLFFWPNTTYINETFARYEWWSNLGGWWQALPVGIAGLFGGFLSCVWVGWYFAVSLGFNGHIREAGRVAKVRQFKQFIRFRLRENDLTGYVIAVDDPKERGRDLTPKIVDVFQLTRSLPTENPQP